MIENPEQFSEDDLLDHLLAQAKWPEPTPQSVDRLRRLYFRTRGSDRVRALLPIAAAAIIVITISAWVWMSSPHRKKQIAVTSPSSVPIVPAVQSRSPTSFEQAILYSIPKQPRKSGHTTKPSTQPSLQPPTTLAQLARQAPSGKGRQNLLSSLLRHRTANAVSLYLQFVESPQTRSDALAALDDVPEPVIAEMFNCLDDSRISTRMAAARALGRIDGPVITARLAAMVEQNQNRREALAALISSDGPDAMHFVARARHNLTLNSTIQVLQLELKQRTKQGVGT